MKSTLRAVFYLIANALWMGLLFPIACLAMLVTWNTDTSLFLARRVWSPFLVWISGSTMTVEGRENVDPARPTIYVVNHQSTLDIPVLFMALPINFRFIVKEELRWVPLLGWYLWVAKFIFVDRTNQKRAIRSLQLAGEKIRGGKSIAVFPEGTRSAQGAVLPFKKGPFALAISARVAVCPVTIEGTWRVMPKNSFNVKAGTIRVKIGKPIDAAAFADLGRDALLKAVRDQIIKQSLEMGGPGGDPSDSIALRGKEGIGRARPATEPEAEPDREMHPS